MWRSLVLSSGEKLSVRDNWVIVTKEDGKTISLPISDLYCVVIDNLQMSVTIPVLTHLAANKIHLVVCDDHHLPASVLYPLNINYHSLHVFKKQIQMDEGFKGELWQRIIKAKIHNQAVCLDNVFVEKEIVGLIHLYADYVVGQDRDNYEGQAARVFFKSLYGQSFHRSDETAINSALNYGYAIMRSCMAKALVSYGFNCMLGIHHCSEQNEFNLADDLMEPFRSVIDQYVCTHQDEFQSDLSRENRSHLINLINSHVIFRGKKQSVRNAIDLTAKSLASALEYAQPSRLSLPELITEDSLCD